jgi:hypothetical protein
MKKNAKDIIYSYVGYYAVFEKEYNTSKRF